MKISAYAQIDFYLHSFNRTNGVRSGLERHTAVRIRCSAFHCRQENTLHVQNEQNRSSYQQITSSCGSCVMLNQRVDVLQQNIHWLWIQHQLLQVILMSIKAIKEKMCFDFPHTFLKNCSESFVGGSFNQLDRFLSLNS